MYLHRWPLRRKSAAGAGVDARDKARSGRPRKIPEWKRSASCATKDLHRATIPQRTGGWQFAVDPVTRMCLGAKEHIQNECPSDKHDLLQELLQVPGVLCDLIMHDDACHLEAFVRKRYPEVYRKVKYFTIDEWHRRNHKCTKRDLTADEQARVAGLNGSISEQFNAFIRQFNFWLNYLRPSAHRFWLWEIIHFYNSNVRELSTAWNTKPRSNTPKRANPQRAAHRANAKRPRLQ